MQRYGTPTARRAVPTTEGSYTLVTTATVTLLIDDGEYKLDGKQLVCTRCTAPVGDTGESLGWLLAAARKHTPGHAQQPRDLLAELAGERPTLRPAVPPIRTLLDHEPEGAAVL